MAQFLAFILALLIIGCDHGGSSADRANQSPPTSAVQKSAVTRRTISEPSFQLLDSAVDCFGKSKDELLQHLGVQPTQTFSGMYFFEVPGLNSTKSELRVYFDQENKVSGFSLAAKIAPSTAGAIWDDARGARSGPESVHYYKEQMDKFLDRPTPATSDEIIRDPPGVWFTGKTEKGLDLMIGSPSYGSATGFNPSEFHARTLPVQATRSVNTSTDRIELGPFSLNPSFFWRSVGTALSVPWDVGNISPQVPVRVDVTILPKLDAEHLSGFPDGSNPAVQGSEAQLLDASRHVDERLKSLNRTLDRTLQNLGGRSANMSDSTTRVTVKSAAAKALLDRALSKGIRENKMVLVLFGSSDNEWSQKFDAMLSAPACKSIFERNFAITHVNVFEYGAHSKLETMGGKELITAMGYRVPVTPFFAVLSLGGVKLDDSILTDGMNMGFPTEPDEVAAFMAILKKRAPRMTDAERTAVESYLRESKE